MSTLVCARLSLADALVRIHTAGFEYVEVAAMHKWVHLRPADFVGRVDAASEELSALCARAGVVPVSFTADTMGSLDEQIAQVRALAEVAAAIGMGVVTLMPSKLDSPVEEDIARFRRFLVAVSDLSVTLSLNTHLGTHSEDPATALRYVQEAPGLGITLDPAHYLAGSHWNGGVRALFPYVRGTQLRASGRQMADIQLPVAEGEIDIVSLVSTLHSVGYAGDLVIEYFDPGDDPPRFDYLLEAAKLRLLLDSVA